MSLPAEIKTEAALSLIGAPNGDLRHLYCLPKRKNVSPLPGRRGWLFRTEHIERVRVLIREADLTLPAACRVVAAEVEGRV